MEILVIAFVLEDVADTFELNSVQKGLIGSASFFGEPEGYSRVCRDKGTYMRDAGYGDFAKVEM